MLSGLICTLFSFQGIAKSLKNMSLICISLDGLNVQWDQPSSIAEMSFALVLISTLNNLTQLSLNGWRLSNEDAFDLGKTIREKLSSNVLELSLKNVPSQTNRLVVKVGEESGKVTVSRGSSGCLYRFKKTGRAPSFLNKMMLITSSWKEWWIAILSLSVILKLWSFVCSLNTNQIVRSLL